MEEFPKFLGSLILLILGAGSIKLNEPIYHYTGENFCRFSASVVIFGHLHWFYGSFGMALFRWMIIKHSTKTWFKERTVGVLIGIISLAITAIYTFSTVNIPKTTHDAAYLCLGRSREFLVSYYYYTQNSAGLIGNSISYQILGAFNITIVSSEFALHMLMCMYLRKNDIFVAQYLTKESLKRRKRKNVINFAGSLSCMVTKVLWLLTIVSLGKVYEQLGESWFILLICITLGMDSWLSLSIVATSPPLRRECSDIQKNVTDCLSIAWVKVLSRRGQQKLPLI